MNQFGNLYSQYYDLLYSDKNYEKEVEYINNLINEYKPNSCSLLDLGCGTGKHASLFAKKGFKTFGIDQSKEMLNIAKQKKIKNLEFIHSNIQNFSLSKKFDVITALFHVMSYQNSNLELKNILKNIKKHLKKNGIFIFDFWYGPAVLSDLPSNRVKRLDNKNIKVTRFAEPSIDNLSNIVNVHYDIFIEDKTTQKITHKTEIHPMRYFFDLELEEIIVNNGLRILNKFEWLSKKIPNFNSWNVVWIIKK